MTRAVTYQNRNCPLCNADRFEELYAWKKEVKTTRDTYLFDLHEGICQSCGLVYMNPVFDEEFLLEYYHSKHLYAGGSLDYNLENRIELLKRFAGGRKRLAEVGAGEGSYVKAVRQLGIEAIGIEPNQDSGGKTVDDFQSESGSYDLIVSNHVMEHITRPFEFLDQVHRLLDTEGRIIFEVPNLHLYGQYSSAIFHEHVMHFSPGTLSRMLNLAGFKVEHLEFKTLSRPLGFVIVACKTNKPVSATEPVNEYLVNKSYFLSAVEDVQGRNQRYAALAKHLSEILQAEAKVICWGGNAIFQDFSQHLTEDVRQSLILVDANPKKWNTPLDESDPIIVHAPESISQLENAPHQAVICAVSWASQIRQDLGRLGIASERIHVAPY